MLRKVGLKKRCTELCSVGVGAAPEETKKREQRPEEAEEKKGNDSAETTAVNDISVALSEGSQGRLAELLSQFPIEDAARMLASASKINERKRAGISMPLVPAYFLGDCSSSCLT